MMNGLGWEFFSNLSAIPSVVGPSVPQAKWQSHIFRLFWKAKSVEADVILDGRMFQNTGPKAENAILLDLTSWNTLANGVQSRYFPVEQVRQISPSGWDSSSDTLNPCHKGL